VTADPVPQASKGKHTVTAPRLEFMCGDAATMVRGDLKSELLTFDLDAPDAREASRTRSE
jgi:hypothetical protein